MKGFSLLELLVVLALAAAATAVVLPRYEGMAEVIALKSSARELAAALRAARGEAIARRREVAITVDVRERRYALDGSGRSRRFAAGLAVEIVVAHTEMAAGAGAIRFFPDGSSTGGRVRLEARRQAAVVDVDWLTGRVAIHD